MASESCHRGSNSLPLEFGSRLRKDEAGGWGQCFDSVGLITGRTSVLLIYSRTNCVRKLSDS